MVQPPLLFFFDYVDPASYLQDVLLERRGIGADADAREVERIPLEIRPPPSSVVNPEEPEWRAFHHSMEQLARTLDVPFTRSETGRVPWTRKAHELRFHADEKGCFPQVHRALFEAHFVEKRDLGRVDVLVEIAARLGLDRTEVKTVLDVDRFAGSVRDARNRATERGVVGVPTLMTEGRKLEGFQGPEVLEQFLDQESSGPDGTDP